VRLSTTIISLSFLLAVGSGCFQPETAPTPEVAEHASSAVNTVPPRQEPRRTPAPRDGSPIGKDRLDAPVDGAAALAATLRPFDSPLPSREQLEAGFGNPLELLLELSSTSTDPLVRSNATRLLGLFPESGQAVSRLLEIAMDGEALRTDRVGAIDGLNRRDILDEAVADRLLPLLGEPDPIVQTAAVRLLGPWPSAEPALQQLADSDDTHPDVRRFARRALETDSSK